MFTELQRRLDKEHGPGVVPLPGTRTLYRLMVHLDRGRRNFVSEASRRVSVNRPDRPFTPVTALRPGEDVPIDTNKLDIMCRYADGVIRRAKLTAACARLVTDRVWFAGDSGGCVDGALHQPRHRPARRGAALAG